MGFFAQRLAQVKAQKQVTSDVLTTNEQLIMQWIDHRRELSAIQSMTERIARKATFLSIYDGFIDGVLSRTDGGVLAEKDAQMFAELLIWHIDCNQLVRAHEMTEYAIATSLAAPDRYNRQLPVIVADEVGDGALRPDADTTSEILVKFQEVLADSDMPDQSRAKLHKAAGYALIRETQLESALDELQTALGFDEKCGVKKDIERLTRDIKNASKNEGEKDTSEGNNKANA